MRIIDVPENNLTLVGPDNWDTERLGPCETIRAHRDADGYTVTMELDQAEFAAILKGGKLKLKIFGAAFPPVSIWVAE